MPIVPRYDETKVRETALPVNRVATEAPRDVFGGGDSAKQVFSAINETATTVISSMHQAAQKEKSKADEVAVQDAYLKTVQLKNKLFWDPKHGAMTKRGKDALGAADEYGTQYDAGTEEIYRSLSTESQRAAYDEKRKQLRSDLDSHLQKHAFMEIQKFDDETTKSGLGTIREEAVLNFQDSGRVQQSVQTQEAMLRSFADRHGKSPEWLQEQVQDARSKTHTAVIQRMLANGQDLLAQNYFTQVKDQVGGGEITGLEKALEEGTLRGQGQRLSDQFTAGATTMTEALERVKTVEDPRVRDEVTKRVREHFSLKKAAEADERDQIVIEAMNLVEQTKSRDSISPDKWARLTAAERNAVESRLKQAITGIPAETDWTLYYDLKSIASSEGMREKFLRENLVAHKHKLADTEFKELVTLQTALRKGDGGAKNSLDDFRTEDSIIRDSLLAAGIDTTPKAGKSDATKLALFRKRVADRQRIEQQRLGRKLDNREFQKVVDELMVEGVVRGSGIKLRGTADENMEPYTIFQTKKRMYEFTPGEMPLVPVDQVPVEERAKIEQVLRARNLPVTEQRISELYSRKVAKGFSNGAQ